MTLNDYLLLYLTQYGLPVLFGVIVFAALGVPLPRDVAAADRGRVRG